MDKALVLKTGEAERLPWEFESLALCQTSIETETWLNASTSTLPMCRA